MAFLFSIAGKMVTALFAWESLKYLLLFYLFGAAALPLSHRLIHRARLTWLPAAKVLGLSLLTYAAWIAGHQGIRLIPYSTVSLAILLALGAAAAGWGWWRGGRVILARLRRRSWAALTGEILFLLAFAFMAVLRMHAHGIRDQEKYMDLAFLNACMNHRDLPPPDPWRYNLPINYYYGGYLQMATPARLTATPPEVAYNLAVAMLFALACQLVFSIGYELAPRRRWGLLAVAAVLLMSNLDPALQHWQHWREHNPYKAFMLDWWRPSRVIHDGPPGGQQATINEFPFFSFFHADLHPHMVAIPYVLLFVALLLNLIADPRPGLAGFGRGRWRWARLMALAWALGSLALINGFDFITFTFVLAAALAVREWLARRGRGWRRLARAIGIWFLVTFLAWLMFSPFFFYYQAPLKSKPFVHPAGTPLGRALVQHIQNDLAFGFAEYHSDPGEFLTFWGIQLVTVALFLSRPLWRVSRRTVQAAAACGAVLAWWLLYLALGTLVTATLAWLLLLAFWDLVASRRAGRARGETFVLVLFAASLIILLACEWIYMRDGYGRVLQRMNTLFKFYYPCWIMIGLGLPAALRAVMREVKAFGPGRWRVAAVLTPALLLVALGMEYPCYVTWARVAHRDDFRLGPPSLNGAAYMAREHPGDWAAILWLRAHARPGAVILEAPGGAYTYHARMATHAPLRAVLGWANHEQVWRGTSANDLKEDARRIYVSPDLAPVRPLLERYGVKYIYVGELERKEFPPAGLEKFKALPPVYQDPAHGVVIYQATEN